METGTYPFIVFYLFLSIRLLQVGIMIGHNDLCIWSCNSLLTPLAARARVSQQDYENNIRRTVEYLRRLPRTLVILLDPCDVTLVMKGTDKPPRCKVGRRATCCSSGDLNCYIPPVACS